MSRVTFCQSVKSKGRKSCEYCCIQMTIAERLLHMQVSARSCRYRQRYAQSGVARKVDFIGSTW
jgi:hypothetical protein